jgi:phosphonate transport system substrate-binding protein
MQKSPLELPKWARIKRFSVQAAWRVGLCVGLAGAATFAVQFIRGMRETPEPLVEVLQNRPGQQRDSFVEPRNKLRFAVAAMVSPKETYSTYRQFVQRISKDIGKEEAFVVRPSCEAMRRALTQREVDAAFVCTGTAINLYKRYQNLLSQP